MLPDRFFVKICTWAYFKNIFSYINIKYVFFSQIRNHFSIPISVFQGDTLLGSASPENEFNIPLESYR